MKLKYFLNYALFISVLLLSSCTKDRIGMQDEPNKAKIALFNFATPTRPSAPNFTTGVVGYFFSLDGIRLYTMAMPTSKATGYFLTEPGTRTIIADTSAIQQNVLNPSAAVVTTNLPVEANKYYSVYYSRLAHNPDITTTVDDLSRPTSNKVKIRVINLSPDAGSLDIAGRLTTVSTARVNMFTNLVYRANNNFIEIDPGFYSLEVKLNNTATVLTTFTDDNQNPPLMQASGTSRANFSMLFENGKIYTLIIHGYRTANSIAPQLAQPMSVSAAVNLFF